jgi:hypothetical protein
MDGNSHGGVIALLVCFFEMAAWSECTQVIGYSQVGQSDVRFLSY